MSGGRHPPPDNGEPLVAGTDSLRLDKWLFQARFVKTRALAAQLIRDGHVRLNGRRVETPAKAARPGDVLTLALPRATRVVEVRGLGSRRGPASEAAHLYRDLTGTQG